MGRGAVGGGGGGKGGRPDGKGGGGPGSSSIGVSNISSELCVNDGDGERGWGGGIFADVSAGIFSPGAGRTGRTGREVRGGGGGTMKGGGGGTFVGPISAL